MLLQILIANSQSLSTLRERSHGVAELKRHWGPGVSGLGPASLQPPLSPLQGTPSLILSQALITRFSLFLCVDDASPRSSPPPVPPRPLQASAFPGL